MFPCQHPQLSSTSWDFSEQYLTEHRHKDAVVAVVDVDVVHVVAGVHVGAVV